MKSITYVSKVVVNQSGISVPIGLSQILRHARKKNARHQITGFLSYHNGRYIQVLEGGGNKVDELYKEIQSDNRHAQVRTIFDIPIKQRAFPDWNMKLLTSIKRDSNVKRFISDRHKDISCFTNEQKALLEHFYQLVGEPFSNENSYEGKSLSLLAWPDFKVIKQSPVVIELCARLMSSPQPYNELIADGRLGTKQQVDVLLLKFQTLDILKVINSDKNPPSSRTEQSSSSFYLKMRKLLKLA